MEEGKQSEAGLSCTGRRASTREHRELSISKAPPAREDPAREKGKDRMQRAALAAVRAHTSTDLHSQALGEVTLSFQSRAGNCSEDTLRADPAAFAD